MIELLETMDLPPWSSAKQLRIDRMNICIPMLYRYAESQTLVLKSFLGLMKLGPYPIITCIRKKMKHERQQGKTLKFDSELKFEIKAFHMQRNKRQKKCQIIFTRSDLVTNNLHKK